MERGEYIRNVVPSPERREGQGASEHAPLIALKNLSKTYSSGEVEVRAVRDIDIDIDRGEFVAIMGASGSGKSTLMNVLGCLDQPTGGTYVLDGIGIAGMNRSSLAAIRNRKLGFVFQSFNLLPRTSALENVELPMLYNIPLVPHQERHARALAALQHVGLESRRDHHPNQLSGGQQQRIAIARALVNNPQIVLADEPTGNLDTRTSIEIMGLFQELNQTGITIVMVTHELDIAAYCKRIIVMRDGRIISDSRAERPRSAREELDALDRAERNAKVA